MGMNKQEREYIEYRPDLRLHVDVMAIVNQESPNQAYEIPEEVQEALEKSACSLLGKAFSALEQADVLLDNLEENLQNTTAEGISFQDYKNNKESKDGDPHLIHQWEDHHAGTVDGKLLGEVYPLVLGARQHLVDNINLLNNELVVGDINHDTHGAVCSAEEKKLNNIVRNDIANQDPAVLEELKTRNELLDAIDGAIDTVQNFLNDATELAEATVNDLFRGDVGAVVGFMAEAKPEQLESIGKLSEIGFAQMASESEDIKERLDRVQSANEVLHAEVKELRSLKLSAGKTLDWLSTVDTNYDESSITEIIDNTLLATTTILDGYDAVLLDMHKTNEMASMQYEDIITNLYLKESQRQQNRITKEVKKYYDKTDPNKDRQTKRFTQNMGYHKGMKKKKTHKKRGLTRGTK